MSNYFQNYTADTAILIHLKLFILGVLSFPLFPLLLVSHIILTGYHARQYQIGTQAAYGIC